MRSWSRAPAAASVALLASVLATACGLGPYGEEYLPTWIEYGTPIVAAIETYRQEHGSYPEDLAALPNPPQPADIPGCQAITLSSGEEKGEPYFRLHLDIHLRELVLYDSRGEYEGIDWGTTVVRDGWLYTRD